MRKNNYINPKDIKRICLIAPTRSERIGDMLMNSVAWKNIREKYKEAFICLLILHGKNFSSPFIELLNPNSIINEIVLIEKGNNLRWYLKVIKLIREKKFDLIVDFRHEGLRSGIITLFSGAKYRVGSVELLGKGLFYNIKAKPHISLLQRLRLIPQIVEHWRDYSLNVIKPLGIDGNNSMFLERFPEGENFANKFFKKNNLDENDLLVGFFPGKDLYDTRAWKDFEFAKLGEEIIKKYSAKIIILGEMSFNDLTKKIYNLMDKKPIILIERTTLKEIVGIISKLKLLITVDGGIYHIAVALGIPTVAIFGPTNPFVYGYFDEKNKIIQKDVGCNPCSKEVKKNRGVETCINFADCKNDIKCMKEINYLDVLSKVEEVINLG